MSNIFERFPLEVRPEPDQLMRELEGMPERLRILVGCAIDSALESGIGMSRFTFTADENDTYTGDFHSWRQAAHVLKNTGEGVA